MVRFSRLYSRADFGVESPLVIVETHISPGLPGFNLVGLPETALRESRERVRSALLNSGFDYPAQRITINLAPADMPKRGGRHDLAIALGILTASGQLPEKACAGLEFVGELALSGQLRPIRGATCATLACRNEGRQLILPSANRTEAAVVPDSSALTADSLCAVCNALKGLEPLPQVEFAPLAAACTAEAELAHVRGQMRACRALEIAAAGGHSLLLSGPPGTGKTLLASRLPSLLPPLTAEECVETSTIRSAAGLPPMDSRNPPWRAPHHSLSVSAMVGGGSLPRPGEVSLAHKGVLFLDEAAEFRRDALEALRQPLESHKVLVSRARYTALFPAQFQLLVAMNPCPCGYRGDPNKVCRCAPAQLRKYWMKLSGPMLDRIDLHVEMLSPTAHEWEQQADPGERPRSEEVRQRVLAARSRCRAARGTNALADNDELETGLGISGPASRMLGAAMNRMRLSPRARGRILRLSRTIADLDDSDEIAEPHLAEALSYRMDARLLQ